MPALIYSYFEEGVVVGKCQVNGKEKDKLMFKCKTCIKKDPSNKDEKFAKYTINQGMLKSREKVLAELCDSEDDYENSDSKSEEGDSLIDCDEWDEIIDDFKENEIS